MNTKQNNQTRERETGTAQESAGEQKRARLDRITKWLDGHNEKRLALALELAEFTAAWSERNRRNELDIQAMRTALADFMKEENLA